MTKKAVHVSGKRKKAIARATVYEGSGKIMINKRLLQYYTPELSRLRIQEPLILAGDFANKVDININVIGGGFQAQTDAARLCVARGLLEFTGSKQLKQIFLDYDRNLLIADVRRNEPHKPNDSKPRKKRQKSYR